MINKNQSKSSVILMLLAGQPLYSCSNHHSAHMLQEEQQKASSRSAATGDDNISDYSIEAAFDAIKKLDNQRLKKIIEKHPEYVNQSFSFYFLSKYMYSRDELMYDEFGNHNYRGSMEDTEFGRCDCIFDESCYEIFANSNRYQMSLRAVAISCNNIDAVKILLANKVEVPGAVVSQDDVARCELLYAIHARLSQARSSLEIIQLLVENMNEHGVEWRNQGLPYLYLAVKKGNIEVVRFLLDQNENPNQVVRDRLRLDSFIPLHEAARLGSIELVKILVEQGADVNLKDDRMYPVLFFALHNTEVVKFLIDNGSDNTEAVFKPDGISLKRQRYMEPNIEAVVKNNAAVLELLPSKNLDLRYSDLNFLHIAIECNAEKSADYLLTHNPKLCNQVDRKNRTPLACILECIEKDFYTDTREKLRSWLPICYKLIDNLDVNNTSHTSRHDDYLDIALSLSNFYPELALKLLDKGVIIGEKARSRISGGWSGNYNFNKESIYAKNDRIKALRFALILNGGYMDDMNMKDINIKDMDCLKDDVYHYLLQEKKWSSARICSSVYLTRSVNKAASMCTNLYKSEFNLTDA